jgi:hypothetical protein
MDNSLVVQLGMNIQSLEAGLNKSNSLLNGFKDKIGELGKTFVTAFAVERVAEFGVEISKLAGQADGVSRVFDQIKGSSKALQEMTEATQGTVSQLNLMKYAVQADNFNIPIEQMGKLFDFAHQRALATGQSVDYLVQSIVTGIGRKSPLILDNLGISAVTLREKLKGVGTETASVADIAKVVGEIATESINKFGLASETTASKMEALSASWENFKVALGQTLNQVGVITLLQNLTKAMDALGDAFKKNTHIAKDEAGKLAEYIISVLNDKNTDKDTYFKFLNDLPKIAQDAGIQIKSLTDGTRSFFYIFKNPVKFVDEKTVEAIKNIDFYEKEIKYLREQEGQALGANLTKIQSTIEAEQAKLDVLKLQYQLQRDAANSSTLGKMAGFDTQFGLDPKLAKTNVSAPADDLNKITKALQAGKKAMDDLVKNTPTYKNSFDIIFDERKIKQFAFVLNSGVQSIVTDMAVALGSFASGAVSSDQIFSTLLASVGNMAIQLGQLAIGAGIAIEAIQVALTSLNPVVAIAAGIALVALGSAVKGAAANIAKGGGGGSHSVAQSSVSSYGRSSDNTTQVYGSIKISGQDLWVVLSNYKTNSNYTRIG